MMNTDTNAISLNIPETASHASIVELESGELFVALKLPAVLEVLVGGEIYGLRWADVPEDSRGHILQGLLRGGYSKGLQDATNSIPKTEGEEKRHAARLEKNALYQNGSFSFGASRGPARAPETQVIWRITKKFALLSGEFKKAADWDSAYKGSKTQAWTEFTQAEAQARIRTYILKTAEDKIKSAGLKGTAAIAKLKAVEDSPKLAERIEATYQEQYAEIHAELFEKAPEVEIDLDDLI